MIVCIIPARGGSKRIPRKNVRLFAGKPIIAHSIEAARSSGLFDRVVVSTEDEEIIKVSRDYGAEVPFTRPRELADDHTTTDQVFIHALEELEKEGAQLDYACCLYATAPFVDGDLIRSGLLLLKENHSTSCFTVARFSYPIFRALKINDRGRIEMIWPEHRLTRSQDLPDAFHDAGQFYWVDVQKYKNERKIFSSDSIPLVIPSWRVQDIDTLEDWERAQIIYAVLKKQSCDP